MAPFTRPLFASLAVAAALAGAYASGCEPQQNPTEYTPITGIQILPSSLLQGLQCGTEGANVYRYVAVVSYAVDGGPTSNPIASDVFDCFTNGVFENLPSSDAGSQEFFLRIFAYDLEALPGAFTCPDGVSANGAACGAEDAHAAASGAGAQWTTTCTATQQQGIPVLAVCQPLVAVSL